MPGGRCQAEADVGGYDRAEDGLALSTDVEQAGTEGQPDTKPGADQRSCLRGRLGDRTDIRRWRL